MTLPGILKVVGFGHTHEVDQVGHVVRKIRSRGSVREGANGTPAVLAPRYPVAGSGRLEAIAEFGDVGADVASIGGVAGPDGLLLGGPGGVVGAAGAAEAVGEGFGAAGGAAVGALDEDAPGGGLGRGRVPLGGQLGRDLVQEPAADEGDG